MNIDKKISIPATSVTRASEADLDKTMYFTNTLSLFRISTFNVDIYTEALKKAKVKLNKKILEKGSIIYDFLFF